MSKSNVSLSMRALYLVFALESLSLFATRLSMSTSALGLMLAGVSGLPGTVATDYLRSWYKRSRSRTSRVRDAASVSRSPTLFSRFWRSVRSFLSRPRGSRSAYGAFSFLHP